MILQGIWGFPKIRGLFFGIPIIRTIVCRGLYWGTLILENHIGSRDYTKYLRFRPPMLQTDMETGTFFRVLV